MGSFRCVSFHLVFLILFAATGCKNSATRLESAQHAGKTDKKNTHSSMQNSHKSSTDDQYDNSPDVKLIPITNRQGRVGFVVKNYHGVEVKLQHQVVLERKVDNIWKDDLSHELSLRYSCEVEPKACISLMPGAELFPPVWQAKQHGSQCSNRVGPSLVAGTYRLVAKACDSSYKVKSEAFKLD